MSIGRPIRTAPKDGTAIIIYGELRLPNSFGEETICKTVIIGGWCTQLGWMPHCGLAHGMRIEPDRWMPLPKSMGEQFVLFNKLQLYVNSPKCKDVTKEEFVSDE